MNPMLVNAELETADPFTPSRRWDDPPVLVALAAIIVAAVWLDTLVEPRHPADSSAEAGFARDMSAHHAQGVGLAELARSRTADEEVRARATDISLTQQAQIGQMSGWLSAWGLSPLGAASPWSGWAMPHAPLCQEWPPRPRSPPWPPLPFSEVDVRFLRLMIRHHRGGVLMARGALVRASRPEVLTLASAVAEAAGFSGLVLFLISGLGGLETLSNSQLTFSYSPSLARMAVTAALGGRRRAPRGARAFAVRAAPRHGEGQARPGLRRSSGTGPPPLGRNCIPVRRAGRPVTAEPALATVQSLVEATVFVVPLVFFVFVLVRGSRAKKGGTDNDESDR